MTTIADLLLPAPTHADLADFRRVMSARAGHELSAREMGELLGYRGRGVADRRWREYCAGRHLDPHRWTLALLQHELHPTHATRPIESSFNSMERGAPMSKMLELTACYDTNDTKVTEQHPVKVLIDLEAIQAVTMKEEGSLFCEVSLRPSFPAYGESDVGETVAQDQRVLLVFEPYHEIRSVLAEHRGVVKCVPTQTSIRL